MPGNSQELNTLVQVLFTSMPIIGALLLLYRESLRRKLDNVESVAAGLMFVGFLLFIGWMGYWIATIVGGVGFIGVIVSSRIGKKEVIMELDKPDGRIQDLLVEIEKMDLGPVFGKNFEDEDIYLDGREFVDCSFKKCRLFSHLGHWRISGKTNLVDCNFRFQYPASVVWDTTVKMSRE